MPYYTGAIAVARLLILSVAVVGLLNVDPAFAQTPDDNVEVMVCPDASQSSFVLNEPQSDSVTDQEKSVVSGSVMLISQVDVFLDETYSHTVALGSRDVSFESVISLPPGTHTLKLVATDSCSNVTHTKSVVVTYEPAIQPSIGNEVPTQVDGNSITPSADPPNAEPTKNIAEEIVDDYIITPIVNIAKALDIISLPGGSSDQTWQNTTKSVSFVFGSSLLLAVAYIALAGPIPSKLALLPYPKGRLLGGMSVIGLLLLLLVFIL